MNHRRYVRNPFNRIVGPSDVRYRSARRGLTGPTDARRGRLAHGIDELGFLDDMARQEELGIAPLLAAAIPALLPIAQNLLGGILGGSGSAAGGAEGGAGGILSSILPMLTGALGGGGAAAASNGAGAGAGVSLAGIANLLSTVPSPIRDQVRQVLNEVRAASGTLDDVSRRITSEVDAAFQPPVNAALDALARTQTQTDATQEHRAIVQDTERWNRNTQNQAAILARLDAISARLGNGARVLSPGAVNVVGPGLVDLLSPRPSS